MIAELNTWDWKEAFGYAGEPGTEGSAGVRPCVPGFANLEPFTREDVVEIAAMKEGENDEAPWYIYGRLKDGRWFYLEHARDSSARRKTGNSISCGAR